MRSITVVGVANRAHRLRISLERTTGGHHIQLLAQSRIGFKVAWVVLLKSDYLQGWIPALSGNLFLSLSTLTEGFFSVSTQNSLCCNLTVVFSLCSSEKSLISSFL